jgi:ABC-type nickel/cobalt efflux system permease component RcnA
MIALLDTPPTVTWLYLPFAVLVGALHGLEPGHSKTMMAAFIIAIRGTVRQAVLLGVSATISHTAVIWLLAALALHFKNQFTAEQAEPWLKAGSGILVIGMAWWMAWRTWRSAHAFAEAHPHDHEHDAHEHPHHGHESEDAHSLAHARQIEEQFGESRSATTGQIILFGLTGGLLPCPAALTVLLLCLQTGKSILGFSVVLAFSVGLALTLVSVGAAAAWGLRHAEKRFSGLSAWATKAPYFSSAVLTFLGVYLLVSGLKELGG